MSGLMTMKFALLVLLTTDCEAHSAPVQLTHVYPLSPVLTVPKTSNAPKALVVRAHTVRMGPSKPNGGTVDECLAELSSEQQDDKNQITDCLAPMFGTPADENCDLLTEECEPGYVNQRLVGWAKAIIRPKRFDFPFTPMRAFRGFRPQMR